MISPDFEYCNLRRVVYGGATFVPVCVKCGRYVKADATIRFTEDGPPVAGPTATCAKCGRTEMYFEGYI